MQPFASFIVCPCGEKLAATTRAVDKGEAGKIGLPGGKIDKGETPLRAAIREAEEEGFAVFGVSTKPIHEAIVEGKLVLWFRASFSYSLSQYKEKGRISPITVPKEEIVKSGYGNDFLKNINF